MQRFLPMAVRRRGRSGLMLAGVSLLVIGVGPGAARDAFVAGARSSEPVALDEAGQRAVLARAAVVGKALGLPDGARREAVRLDDRFAGQTVDEVTTFDASGRPLAIERFAADGRLRTAVRLGWSTARGSLTPGAAGAKAAVVLASVGIAPSGPSMATADPGGQGWTIAWPRQVAGVPVRGDGTWVRLWADGSLHSVATAETPLAAAPSRPMPSDEARRRAELQLAAWSSDSHPVGSIASLELAWVAPNDTFEPSRPDAPETVRRLAWVVRVTPSEALSSRLRAIELYVDAGDGRLLGGDILE